jgi:hypothetical protein
MFIFRFWSKWVLLLLILSVVIGIWWQISSSTPKGPSYAVLTKITDLAQLTTADYTVEKIVEHDSATRGSALSSFLFGDKILFVAVGHATAGVDLRHVKQTNLSYDEQGKLHILLPAATLFQVSLDESRSRVYDRTTGIFTRPSPELETQTRQKALEQIRIAACQADILQKASSNAIVELRRLFPNTEIRGEPAKSCQ